MYIYSSSFNCKLNAYVEVLNTANEDTLFIYTSGLFWFVRKRNCMSAIKLWERNFVPGDPQRQHFIIFQWRNAGEEEIKQVFYIHFPDVLFITEKQNYICSPASKALN